MRQTTATAKITVAFQDMLAFPFQQNLRREDAGARYLYSLGTADNVGQGSRERLRLPGQGLRGSPPLTAAPRFGLRRPIMDLLTIDGLVIDGLTVDAVLRRAVFGGNALWRASRLLIGAYSVFLMGTEADRRVVRSPRPEASVAIGVGNAGRPPVGPGRIG